ncbi:hypothetical protein DL766_004733 [Monosporascus sp. MC13-8B]|uniref:Uncharacterized protein n=1 Tax=Monosporascus cannonballus TaxID=155416 RepID=A0ABY0H621_9PEZI|nr:hypothetical protein DL762_006660 [Monosporascus cannonballus]RYO88465.1 hypothetical protein DL763_005964 [Monosporascus cannonballus]RYP30721.1 hypothetical protein DL766_004733 [Monosporascus sp. MC13-8B]
MRTPKGYDKPQYNPQQDDTATKGEYIEDDKDSIAGKGLLGLYTTMDLEEGGPSEMRQRRSTHVLHRKEKQSLLQAGLTGLFEQPSLALEEARKVSLGETARFMDRQGLFDNAPEAVHN